MKTYDYLAQELDKVGLTEMAKRAREGYYHDYLSPLDLPEITLMQHLAEAAFTAGSFNDKDRHTKIMALRTLVMQGEFDASKEESDEWAASPEGREIFSKLIKGQ